ncbi:MAG: hypothetical protein IPK07_19320 [Deltaproteobacteria bacterium]|nr:hypothetical protein [Deltaproteobacteria bacterium]
MALGASAARAAAPRALTPPELLAVDGERVSGMVSAAPRSMLEIATQSVPACARASDAGARVDRGAATVVTDAEGVASFTIHLESRVAPGEGLVVIARDDARALHAESGCVTIGARAPATLEAPATPVRAGGSVTLTGTNITPGTVLKVFVGTATGGFDAYPSGLVPDATTDTTWSGALSFPWTVSPPDNISLGQGYASLVLVRTDQGFDTSNAVGAVLLGNDALLPKVPSITKLAGLDLSPSSADPSIHVANVEGLITPGAPLVVEGTGFTNPVVNLYTSIGNLGPLTPTTSSQTSIQVDVPANAKIGPGSVQVVNQFSFRISNAVSIPIGEPVSVSAVSVNGNTLEVTGTGFNDDLTVVNFFAARNGQLQNLGGLAENGVPRIILNVTSSTQLSFQRPPAVDAGNAFVEAINPPYIPFTSSGSGASGAVVLP